MFEIVIITASTVTISVSLWALYCNNKTFEDRQKRLRKMGELDSDEFWRAVNQFNQVSYDRHLRTRMLFKDPNRLYDTK